MRKNLFNPTVNTFVFLKNKDIVMSVLLILFSSFFITAEAQKTRKVSDFEIFLPVMEATTIEGNKTINSYTGLPSAMHNIGYLVEEDTPENMAKQFLRENLDVFGLTQKDLAQNLKLHGVRRGRTGVVVRFRQQYKGMPVNKAEITVAINYSFKVTNVANSFRPGVFITKTIPSLSASQARTIAHNHVGLSGTIQHDKVHLMVHDFKGVSRLAYEVDAIAASPIGEWNVLVDAQTGEVFQAMDISFYHHPKHEGHKHGNNKVDPKTEKDRKSSASLSMMVDGTATVFDPDPLALTKSFYGDNGLVDADDAFSQGLADQLVTVTLNSIKFDGTNYTLDGPYAKIDDSEAPNDGLYEQDSPDFLYDRSDDEFEAANVYYHIDASMRYLNETLNLNILPYQYETGVLYDPHGLDGDDNSHYNSGNGKLAFGEGCVDDAEDSDVIHHELGHGLHDWVTMGGLSNFIDGLSEGVGDYWAASYNRSLGHWNITDDPYFWVFNWDGHNECFSGRILNSTDLWPMAIGATPVLLIHASGQIWSTAFMKIYDELGKTTTDIIMWEALGMTNATSSQSDAASAAYQVGIDMGLSGSELQVMYNAFREANYPIPFLPPDGSDLAVKMNSFTGKAVSEGIQLDWTTASEIDNDFFTVERSINGKDFITIEKVASKGQSSSLQTYQSFDKNPLNGLNFYRLKQTDLDGTFSYSETISFRFATSIAVEVFPNPVQEVATLTYIGTNETILEVELMDVAGKVVNSFQWNVVEGKNNRRLSLDQLPKGVYWMRVADGVNNTTKKVVKN